MRVKQATAQEEERERERERERTRGEAHRRGTGCRVAGSVRHGVRATAARREKESIPKKRSLMRRVCAVCFGLGLSSCHIKLEIHSLVKKYKN